MARNPLSRDTFLASFLKNSDCEEIIYLAEQPANQDGNHVRAELQKNFNGLNIIKAFNDASYRMNLAREFTAAQLFGGDRVRANEYLQLSGSYTRDVPQIDYVAESASNLLTYCRMVKRFEERLLQYQLGF